MYIFVCLSVCETWEVNGSHLTSSQKLMDFSIEQLSWRLHAWRGPIAAVPAIVSDSPAHRRGMILYLASLAWRH